MPKAPALATPPSAAVASPKAAPARKTSRKKEAPAVTAAADDGSREQRVREAAYHRWLARGQVEGDPAQDWLDAERDIDGARQG